MDLSTEKIVQLPSPFYPPSLVRRETGCRETYVGARHFPSNLGFPDMPQDKACENIHFSDMYVCCFQVSRNVNWCAHSARETPDAWIPRDQRMIRLTGKHPFNAEAKLQDLFAQGFITPSSLFFVRNHGAVPRIDQQMANDWKLKIHGWVCGEVWSLHSR